MAVAFDVSKPQVCYYCGFVYYRGRKTKYCSAECQKESGMNKAREDRVERSVNKTDTCDACGKQYKPRTSTGRYCSVECRRTAKNNRPRSPVSNMPMESVTYVCSHCGKEYHPKNSERNKYCSRECYFAAKHERSIDRAEILKSEKANKPGHIQNCIICGKNINGRYLRKYCDECGKIVAIKQATELAASKKDTKARKCRKCGKDFEPAYGNKKRNFCSNDCCKRYHKRASKRIRRAKKKDAYVSHVSEIEIYERDNWTCQLCGKRVNRKLISPHPMSATIDHIIPLAKGGTHEPKNAQLAHRICNCKKSDGVGPNGDQLRLFG